MNQSSRTVRREQNTTAVMGHTRPDLPNLHTHSHHQLQSSMSTLPSKPFPSAIHRTRSSNERVEAIAHAYSPPGSNHTHSAHEMHIMSAISLDTGQAYGTSLLYDPHALPAGMSARRGGSTGKASPESLLFRRPIGWLHKLHIRHPPGICHTAKKTSRCGRKLARVLSPGPALPYSVSRSLSSSMSRKALRIILYAQVDHDEGTERG